MGVESLLSKYFLAQWNHDYDFLIFILINPVKSLAKSRRLLSCVLYQSSRSENGQWQPVMLHSNDLFCIVCSIAAQTMAKKVKYVQVNLFQKHLFLSRQYDNRLFIELPVQNMKVPSSEHVVYIKRSEYQNKTKKQFVLLNWWFNEQSVVILWVSWCKDKSFWKRFACISFTVCVNSGYTFYYARSVICICRG